VRSLKPLLGLLSTIFAVGYCGYLVYYFLHISGSLKEAENEGLGPTVVGLGIVGLIFGCVLLVKLYLIFTSLRSTRSSRRGRPDGPSGDDTGGFDADAVIARYMARQAAEAAATPPIVPPRNDGGGPPRPTGFGRKIK
jgi:hypothetical protein